MARAMNAYESEEESGLVALIHSLANLEVSDQDRRLHLFSGDLFVYAPRPSTLAFCAASRSIIEQMLGAEPIWAQQRMTEAEFAILFKAASRNFGHIVEGLASVIVADLGCDPTTTFVGLPSLVAMTGFGFIAHGLGMYQHPHRDTWYAASPCQLNWWVPLYGLDAGASLAFHPQYWDLPVQNSSKEFDFDEWFAANRTTQDFVAREPFAQPRPLDPIDLTPEIRISCPPGGIIISSVAQLYSAVPNESLKTHFSVQFQTVSEADLEFGRGASNLDAEPKGTSLSSFVRCSDLSPIPRELVESDLRRRRSEATGAPN